MDHISKTLEANQYQKLSLQEVVESYKHIELTEDEKLEGLIWALRRKEDSIRVAAQMEREAENRKKLLQKTNYDLVKSLMLYRFNTKFEGKFKIDEHNEIIFELMCMYFGNDERFVPMALSAGVDNPSLSKGVFLTGNFGVGKTWFMQLFQQNQRQVYFIKNCKDVADEFMQYGEEGMDQYIKVKKNAVNDTSLFLQKESALCLDDIGTEDIKTHYGNKKNVIGDIIEKKYSNGSTGIMFHGTTNLSADQLREFYGHRVTSRMREMLNFIEVVGEDRRK
jgi:DNA replication protein DnaC